MFMPQLSSRGEPLQPAHSIACAPFLHIQSLYVDAEVLAVEGEVVRALSKTVRGSTFGPRMGPA